MDSGRWNGNNWALVGPNGEPVKVRQSQRVNEWPPARRVSGFNTTSPRGNKPSTVVANEPSTVVTKKSSTSRTSPLTINLKKGPRNILTLLKNEKIPHVVKAALRQVLFNNVTKPNATPAELVRAAKEGGFDSKRLISLYNAMPINNLAKFNNHLAKAVLRHRQERAGKP